jgi:tRNA modification GTPase
MEGTTIAALATAPTPAGIAVVRVSGHRTKLALRALFKGKKDPVRLPRTLVFGDILDFKTGGSIDKGLAVFMPAPWSFTGEDVAEFQFHGSPLLVQKVLRSLYAYGISPAAPGEFTRRAFLNGKMDLAQAEAIADLINAKSEEALRYAGEQLKGRLSSAVAAIGEPLRDLLAEIEATIDFPEEDIAPQRMEEISRGVEVAKAKTKAMLETYAFGQVVKEGYRVLLCGRPNAGKSSLLNLLLGRKRAIVSEVSGTTRDLIEEEAILAGYKFVFCDSAGIRDTHDTVEKIGVELAKERIPWADLVLLIVDANDRSEAWRETMELLRGQAKKVWMVVNKVDLNPGAFSQFFCDSTDCQQNFYVSAKSGAGIGALVEALAEDVAKSSPDKGEVGEVITNERHRDCLLRALEAMDRFVAGAGTVGAPPEILAADLREALGALDEIIGKTYTEDILGRIFSKFCIGK